MTIPCRDLIPLMAALAFVFTGISVASAQQHTHGSGGHASKYAGQETRDIKSLSDDDIAELKRGGGWGLARAAELNGVPGPAHLLELKDKIPLDPEQIARIRALYEDMKTKAIAEGERLIALEHELENRFRSGGMTRQHLSESLSVIGESRTRLRYIHLSTHLQTPAILTTEQIATYNSLRGYKTTACAQIPAGHDPEMWRRHNNCK